MTEIKISENPLKEAQNVMTTMMIAIHNICKEHNIPYWLTDGSLLGSIRHEGFIPWDDDIDIGLLRKDYDKLKKVLRVHLPDQYKIETYNLNTHGKHNWLKIMYLEDFEWVDTNGDHHKGLSIDIFPYDFVKGKNSFSIPGKIFNRASRLIYPSKVNNLKDMIVLLLNRSKLYNFYTPFIKETKTITYGVETPFYGLAFFDIDVIFPLKTGSFEGQKFNIPNKPDTYLTTMYGDYMKLPDEADRAIHMENLQFTGK
ncbi:phosphorylcholine transferase LicD [Neobacillus sp. NPDC097160]|uniref:LicD family protein n=1 Tax=Neobacillus sp. NPDC097160 TaxID=3364298 RepID=UPI0038007791